MVQVQRQLFNVDEYYKMAESGILQPSDRVELIKGEIIRMSPIKSQHSSMVDNLFEKLVLDLHGKYILKSQNPIRLDDFSEPEPDIVVAHFRKDRYRHRHPRPADIYLLIEVADTSLDYDREIKAPLYAEAGIPEYWIVNIADEQIEIFRHLESGEFQEKTTAKAGETATCEAIGFSVKVDDVF
jgi:Uma2 family endonuclease